MGIIRIVTPLVIVSLLLSPAAPVIAAPSSAVARAAPAASQQKPPAPPFGPHFLKPPVMAQPVPPPAVAPGPAPVIQPQVETPTGPAFNWQETENYLILGTDRRPGAGNWRTDTVIIVGLDHKLKRAAVFSVPRDLYIEIPGYGWGRINQVDFLGEQRNGDGGGPALVSQVLSSTLGIATNHWVRLQMDGFIEIVNAIGG
ncbi:MAG TPA: LCP family protein, partial [Caldilineaceae bacterium]|nr:LCP family protein [Caldilineaceae bacterium]